MDSRSREILLSGWLGHVDASLSKLILEKGKLVSFQDGATIYGFEQQQDCLYGIVYGSMEMWVAMNEQDPQFGHVAGPGFWTGETEVVTGKAGVIEMVARGETKLLSINRRTIDEISEIHSGMWPALTLLAIQNQSLAIGAADDLRIRNSTKRLAALLLRLSSRRNAYQGVQPLTSIPVSWTELSEAAGLSRSKVGAILAEFTDNGFIKTQRRSIEIVNAEGIENVLDQ